MVKDVLILGDSISIGYTPFVREILSNQAVVNRPVKEDGSFVNCESTHKALHDLEDWLGGRNWDVIYLNWGLHDIAYRNPESTNHGHRDKINGTLTTSPDKYRDNLKWIIGTLKNRGKQLIGASTTIVPPNELGRFEGDEIKYNFIALEVMQEFDIASDDLHTLTRNFPPHLFQAPGDVHYTLDGYRRIGNHVAKSIGQFL